MPALTLVYPPGNLEPITATGAVYEELEVVYPAAALTALTVVVGAQYLPGPVDPDAVTLAREDITLDFDDVTLDTETYP